MHVENTPADCVSSPGGDAKERRRIPRTTLERLTYISIEPDNGGIVLNVCEEGLGFHSIAPVERSNSIHLSFAERGRRMEADGEIVWTDSAGTAGGLRFKSLPAELRQQIREWAEPYSPADDAPAQSVPRLRALAAATRQPSRRERGSAAVTALIRRGIRVRLRLGGFARGLLTGLLLSGLLAAGFLLHTYRRELGQSLIRFGERLAATPKTQTVAVPQQPESPQSAQLAPDSKPKVASTPVSTPKDLDEDLLTLIPKAQVQPSVPKTHASSTIAPALSPRPNPTKGGEGSAPTAPVVSVPQSAVMAAPNLFPAGPKEQPKAPASPRLKEEAAGVSDGPAPQLFFEIAKYKQRTAAVIERDKVSLLGLPASVVRKGRLWMNSYHIVVGPYTDESVAGVASKTLVSNGYTPRPFERGSRNLTFASKLVVNSVAIPIGECEVRWESYIPNALVKFVQDDDVVLSATGRWEERGSRFEHNAVVYERNAKGQHTLIEIQFAGMDRALVFGKAS